jgi:hypothetical protein
MVVSMWSKLTSTEWTQFTVLHIQQSIGGIVKSFHSEHIGRQKSENGKQYANYHILRMPVNVTSMERPLFLALHHGQSGWLYNDIQP